jgi:hypothetical protein
MAQLDYAIPAEFLDVDERDNAVGRLWRNDAPNPTPVDRAASNGKGYRQ